MKQKATEDFPVFEPDENAFRSMITQSNAGILVHQNYIPLYANPSFAKILGYDSPEEILSLETIMLLLPQEEHERITNFQEARIQDEEAPTGYEMMGLKKNGETIFIYNHSHKIDWQGKPAVCSTITDISDRKLSAVKLEKSNYAEKLLREAIDKVSDMVILYDQNERIIFTNERYHEIYPHSPPKSEITNYSQEDLLRISLKNGLIASPEAKKDPEAWIQTRLEERRNLTHKIGETVHSNGKTYKYQHKKTAEGGTVILQTEITSLKRAEALQKSRRIVLEKLANGDMLPEILTPLVTTTETLYQGLKSAILFKGNEENLFEDIISFPLEKKFLATIKEVIYQKWTERHSSPDHDSSPLIIDDIKNEKIPKEYSNYFKKINIAGIWAEAVTATDDSLIGYFIIFTNVPIQKNDERLALLPNSARLVGIATERKRMEVQKQASHDLLEQKILERSKAHLEKSQYLEMTLNSMNDGIAVFDADQKLTLWNEHFFDLFQLPNHFRKIGTPSIELEKFCRQHDMYTRLTPQNRNKSNETAKIVIGELSYPDGRTIQFRKSPMPDGGRVFIYRDISEQKAALERAQEAENKLRTAVESIDDGFVIYDTNDRLILCNQKYKDIYKESEDLLVPGNKFEDIIRIGAERGQYPEATGRIDEWVADRLKAHLASNTEIQQKLPDGRWLKIAERKTPDGEIVGFRVDITQLKTMQEKAEAASIAKSNFLATMSHEIRTPLNGIMGIAELLQSTKLNKDQNKNVQTIISSGQTLLAIINDILDMSKIEAGGMELEKSPIDVNSLVETVLDPFLELAKEKNLELRMCNTCADNTFVKGDPTRIRQVVWNLVSNAIKFTSSGSIVVGVGDLEYPSTEQETPDRYDLILTIADTGSGISEDRIAAIFDAFTQEDSSITRKHGGTGLGLSIVKQLVELMGGEVTAKSQVGYGTEFRIQIPLERISRESFENSIDQLYSNTNQKIDRPLQILLAEDNRVNADIAKAFLDSLGHQVRHVENGQLAVEEAKKNWADLILMDIRMPVLDGLGATQEIRKMKFGKTIPIIALTAEVFAESHEEFKQVGLSDILTKPFTKKQLTQILEKHYLSSSTAPSTKTIDSSVPKTIPNENAPSILLDNEIGNQPLLDELIKIVGRDTANGLLESGVDTLKSLKLDLNEAVQNEDPPAIREAAHAIKGSCGSLYAIRVQAIGAYMEKEHQNIELIKSLLPILENSAETTYQWWLDNKG